MRQCGPSRGACWHKLALPGKGLRLVLTLVKPIDLEKTPFDVLEARIRTTSAALRESASLLSEAHREEILVREVEGGLVDVLGLDEISDLLDHDIDSGEILGLLADYNFARLRPQKLCEVVLEESIVPAGVPVLLTEAEVKLKGEKWTIHKNDADPFPSSPHAHNYEQGLKMDLRTGDLYQRNARVACGRVEKKYLLKLRDLVEHKNATIALPPLAI